MVFTPITGQLEDGSWPEDVDAAKALFMTEVAHVVEDGGGEITKLESGTLELRLATGEIFHLGTQSVTRAPNLPSRFETGGRYQANPDLYRGIA